MAVKQGRVGLGFEMVWKLIMLFVLLSVLIRTSDAQPGNCEEYKKQSTPEAYAALYNTIYPQNETNTGAKYADETSCLDGKKAKELSKHNQEVAKNQQKQKPDDPCGLEDAFKKAIPKINDVLTKNHGKNCKSGKCILSPTVGMPICRSSSIQAMSLVVILLIIGVCRWAQ